MNRKLIGSRRVGYAGVATALALGGALAGMSPASAADNDDNGEFAASDDVAVVRGDDQPAGDLTYQFDGAYNTNSTVQFSIKGQTCNTTTEIDQAVGFSTTPTVTVSRVRAIGDADPIPAATVALDSRTANCETAGVADRATVNLAMPQSGNDDFLITLSNVSYDVGDTTPLGAVDVKANADSSLDVPTPATVNNATVVDKAFAYTGFDAAENPATDVEIGTALISGQDVSSFSTNDTVDVTVNGATFNTTTAPTATTNTGYSATVAFTGASTATVTVTKDAGATDPLTLALTGLHVDATSPTQVTITSDVDKSGTFKALNNLNYTDERLAGSDRYATASDLFDERVSGNITDAVVASGEAFPDALGGGYLASKKNTGLLLTRSDKLPTDTRLALTSHDVDNVFLLGGGAAISQGVQEEIEALGITVQRVEGANRFGTNEEINKVAGAGADHTALVASGFGFADALAVGPVSYSQDWPLILSEGDMLTDRDKGQLVDLDIDDAIIAGGSAAVSNDVATGLVGEGVDVSRVFGANRFETGTAIAEWETAAPADGGLGFEADAGLSSGLSFADALAAGPVFGNRENALLLIGSGTTPAVSSYLGTKDVGTAGDEVSDLSAVGGSAVVSGPQLLDAARAVQE